jgi:hypothetical protein
MTVIDKDGYSVVGVWSIPVFDAWTPNNLKMTAAAPEMYRILCQICSPERGRGLCAAYVLLHQLEGEPDAEA